MDNKNSHLQMHSFDERKFYSTCHCRKTIKLSWRIFISIFIIRVTIIDTLFSVILLELNSVEFKARLAVWGGARRSFGVHQKHYPSSLVEFHKLPAFL
jgi:hypothetical protein